MVNTLSQKKKGKAKRGRKAAADSNQPSRKPSVHLTAEEYEAYQSHCNRMLITRTGYSPDPHTVIVEYHKIKNMVKIWTERWIREEMPPLSEGQKQKIIQGLDTYCIQEPWDTIQALLSPESRDQFHLYLCEAMVNKLLFTRVLNRPFWFLDGKLDENDEIGDLSFADRLHYLFQRYHEASPVNAVWWRMVTLALANLKKDLSPRDPRDNPPYIFGDENRKRQAGIAERLADHLLADSLFQLLLDKLASAEEETRRCHLIKVFRESVQYFTAHEVTLGGHVKFHQLPEVKQFDPSTGIMFSGLVHDRERNNTPPLIPKPHSRVILVLRPGVCRYDLPNKFVPFDRHRSWAEMPTDIESELLYKAEVMVEAVEASSPSDASQRDPGDADVFHHWT
ncbi:hypothetical protein BO82DRAFT_68889 [Aspergillus uvarum CBS 121591]|uniref:Uncharacterized protein n=1 Tax=Aspergillus uvarum CBS 121591 TaxID=1448315 RepID=A0A319CEP2_9EURO|nr:hypothetical protein BO82DRAFT_68889 [Aspergillus uvarum CBS 121591]PYH82161.1 hypothetical protein BO82DRAFT_68889 [Aspergillus uvarum CBS 121591]